MSASLEDKTHKEHQRILLEGDFKLELRNLRQKHAMEDWVRTLKDWECIAHMTFVWECSMDSGMKCYEKFMKRELPGVSYFYAMEANPGRRGFHIHALFSDTMGVQRKEVWSKWFDKYGRNRIEPIKSSTQVSSYCAKYVTKEGSWWNVKILEDGLRKQTTNKTRPASTGERSGPVPIEARIVVQEKPEAAAPLVSAFPTGAKWKYGNPWEN